MSFLLMLGLLCQGTAPADSPAFVAKLVSPRSAEREAAEARVEELGEAAIPALVKATESSDLELRHRAAFFLDKIEGSRLARPTVVALDFRSKSIKEITESIGAAAGVTIVLEPDGDVRFRSKTITLQDAQPVPLWTAIDRLCGEAALRLEPPVPPWIRQRQMAALGNPGGLRRRVSTGNELTLRILDSPGLSPTSDSGAFRIGLAGLVLDRTRTFVRSQQNPTQPDTTTIFTIAVQVRAEPRLTIAAVEEPRLLEAIDDRGQSLLGPMTNPINHRVPRGMDEFSRNQPLVFSLKYPDEPGKRISRLRGSVRVQVVGRRDDPIIVPLAEADGKTFSSSSASLTVQSSRPGGVGRETALDFSLEGTDVARPAMNAFDVRAGLRPPPSAWGQIEFLDAKGRTCFIADLGGNNAGFGVANQRKISFITQDPAGPPVEARYYGALWAGVEVPFEFRDIPMP